MSEACLEPKLIDSSSICKLSDYIGDLRSGLSRRIESIDIGIPVLISGNIQDNRLDVSNLKYWFLNDPQGANVSNFILEDGDILLCFINSVDQIGKLCIYSDIGRPAIYTTNLFRIKAKDNHDSKFLYYLLTSDICQNWIKLITKPAVNQASFTKGDFLGIQVPYFQDKEIQQKIAKILSTVDNLIENTQTLIDKYTAIKQGMMADLFTRGIDMTTGDTPNSKGSKLRPSVEDAPELYKQTELGWVPKEWEVVLLDNISMRGSGHTPSKSFPEYWNGGIKWVSLADSKKLDNLYIHETDNNISELGLQNSSATKHPKGTVILSRDAGIGKSAILAEEMAVSQHFMAWRCGSALDNYFLYFWLQKMKPNFNAIAMGSTIPTIGLDYFKRLRIAVPKDIKEQEEIGKRLLKIFEKNVTLKAEKKKYELIKKGLMQDLLTGKVRVN